MTAQKTRITVALLEIGACWAVTKDKCVLPNDPLEDQIAQRATYHVHPDKSEPRVEYIQRFDSLKELEAWITQRKPKGRRPEAQRKGRRINVYLSPVDKKQLRQRHGSVQAAIERLVKEELDAT